MYRPVGRLAPSISSALRPQSGTRSAGPTSRPLEISQARCVRSSRRIRSAMKTGESPIIGDAAAQNVLPFGPVGGEGMSKSGAVGPFLGMVDV